MNRSLVTLLALAALAGIGAAAGSAPARRTHASVDYVFDLPAGWRADTSDARVTLVLPPRENSVVFGLRADTDSCPTGWKTTTPLNALLACVRQRFKEGCAFVGTDANRAPERVRTIRHRPRKGVDVIEYTTMVAEGPGWDEEDGGGAVSPDTTASEPEVLRRYVVGPAFLVDLSTPDAPLRIWVLPTCDASPAKETIAAMRVVVESLSRR
jgi:hypothetical protein